MIKRLTLLLCVFALLTACGGSKSGGASSSYRDRGGSSSDDDDWGGGGGGEPPPKPNELKASREEASRLTEENHRMSRELFELKNKLGLPTDE